MPIYSKSTLQFIAMRLINASIAGIVLGLAAFMPATQATPIPSGHAFSKRGWSINKQASPENGFLGPWPQQTNFQHPFPGKQLLRYCYEDENTYDKLSSIVPQAIEMWRPATSVSSLIITPDPQRCSDEHCMCGPQPLKAVLRIWCADRDYSTIGCVCLKTWPSSCDYSC